MSAEAVVVVEGEKSKTAFWRRVGSCDYLKAFKGIQEVGEVNVVAFS